MMILVHLKTLNIIMKGTNIMKEKISLIILLLCLTLLHAVITKPTMNRYEVVSLNETNYVIIDHKENKIYQKYVSPDSGPSEYLEIELPE